MCITLRVTHMPTIKAQQVVYFTYPLETTPPSSRHYTNVPLGLHQHPLEATPISRNYLNISPLHQHPSETTPKAQ